MIKRYSLLVVTLGEKFKIEWCLRDEIDEIDLESKTCDFHHIHFSSIHNGLIPKKAPLPNQALPRAQQSPPRRNLKVEEAVYRIQPNSLRPPQPLGRAAAGAVPCLDSTQ